MLDWMVKYWSILEKGFLAIDPYIFSNMIFYSIKVINTLLRSHWYHSWFFYIPIAMQRKKNIAFSSIIFRNWSLMLHLKIFRHTKKSATCHSPHSTESNYWYCVIELISEFKIKDHLILYIVHHHIIALVYWK